LKKQYFTTYAHIKIFIKLKKTPKDVNNIKENRKMEQQNMAKIKFRRKLEKLKL
jgi:hypothetical protein